MYSGDADGNNKPDRFIMTYWKSKDYGDNDVPNPSTHETSEDPPVLDHAIRSYDMDTDNLIIFDDKYQYSFGPPVSCNSSNSSVRPEGPFLRRITLPRSPAETFSTLFAQLQPASLSGLGMEEDSHSLADLNGDGILDNTDLQILQNAFGTCLGDADFNPQVDYDSDGCVTSLDKAVWLDLFNASAGNQTPRVQCKSIEVAAGSSCTATVAPQDVDNGSFDPDGDNVTLTLDSTGPFGLGEHLVTLTATDSHGASDSCTATVTVVDRTPPSITHVSVDKAVLWPPNHRMVNVAVGYTATDNCGTPSCTLTATSNEPDDGLGDGDTRNDIVVIDSHNVQLRAERSGTGSGRIYTITITCTDLSGNKSIKNVTVIVPKNQSSR